MCVNLCVSVCVCVCRREGIKLAESGSLGG